MATGIGEQLKGMVRRARNYWSDLTDEQGSQKHNTERESSEAMHQRYGGVRTRGESETDALPGDRSGSDSRSRGTAEAQWDDPSRRGDQQGGQPGGGQPDRGQQMRSEGQASRQYAQQGDSGIQKPQTEQMPGQAGASGAGSEADTLRSRQGRRPGQQSH